MTALPSRFYGNPADVCDERRKLSDIAEKIKERKLLRKRRRIQKLTKQAINNGGGKHGK